MTMKQRYITEIRPRLKDELGVRNVHMVPRLEKITVNVGLGSRRKDDKLEEAVIRDLARITGQTPVPRLARKAIAGFKLREGETIGVAVVLRGARMYDFLTRLIRVVLPRIRDFRGLPLSGFDGQGNYSFGIKEHIVFPEVDHERIQDLYGLGITITTTATTDAHGETLLRSLGMPFAEQTDGRK